VVAGVESRLFVHELSGSISATSVLKKGGFEIRFNMNDMK